MAGSKTRDEQPASSAARKEPKPRGELSIEELARVSGGRDAASGLPTGKRQH
ncbi:MAG TPA: hypothetical protein VMT54_00650 [Candidatus Cybelea sp.]|nr:hypothetical protein [Candidatus Cybelea sp.]